MRAKGREVVSCIEHTIQKLQPQPFYAWSVLFSHCASLFDYSCRHVPPIFTLEPAQAIDAATIQAFETLIRATVRDPRATSGRLDAITRRRFHLAARMRGGGIRAREHTYVAPPRRMSWKWTFSVSAKVSVKQNSTGGAGDSHDAGTRASAARAPATSKNDVLIGGAGTG